MVVIVVYVLNAIIQTIMDKSISELIAMNVLRDIQIAVLNTSTDCMIRGDYENAETMERLSDFIEIQFKTYDDEDTLEETS